MSSKVPSYHREIATIIIHLCNFFGANHRETSPTQAAQSRMMCFSMSAAAHVQPHSHVFPLSEQGRIKPRCQPLQLPLHPGDEPQHRGPTVDGAPLLICQAGRRVNKSHMEGHRMTSRAECVAAVTLHSSSCASSHLQDTNCPS